MPTLTCLSTCLYPRHLGQEGRTKAEGVTGFLIETLLLLGGSFHLYCDRQIKCYYTALCPWPNTRNFEGVGAGMESGFSMKLI